MYSTSTYQWNIIRYPVLIDDSGEVKLKDRFQKVHTGTALIFMQDYLIINFNDFKNDVEPSVGNFIFYIHGNQIKRFASGISVRINLKKNPQAKREFLIRYPFNDYQATSKHQNDSNNFKKSKNAVFEKNSPEYEEVKKHYRRFDTLLGREYNLMVISKSATKEEKVFAREAFEQIYLHEAIFSFFRGIKAYKSYKHFSGDVEETIEHYLRLAIQHGFFEKDAISNYIDDYCNTINRNPAHLIKYFGELYDQIIKEAQRQASK